MRIRSERKCDFLALCGSSYYYLKLTKLSSTIIYLPHWLWLVIVVSLLLIAWLMATRTSSRRFRHLAWIVSGLATWQLGSLVYVYVRWWTKLAADDVTSKLLPPHSLFYLSKVQTEITSLAIGWLVALVLFWFLKKFFLDRHHGSFLDGTDAALLTLGTAAVGWPTIFPFLAAVFVFAVVIMIGLVIVRKRTVHDRLVITHAIIPAAIAVLMTESWILSVTKLGKIGF